MSSQGRPQSITQKELLSAALNLVNENRSISTLSLREVTREAGIAANSFYRHFRTMDELAISLIELAGEQLRKIINKARHVIKDNNVSIVQSSMEVFVEQLYSDEGYLPLLLREGKVGSKAFRDTIERQLCYFEEELKEDLILIGKQKGNSLYCPDLVAKAITRLVFSMGAVALETSKEEQQKLLKDSVEMIDMIISGAMVMNTHFRNKENSY